MPGPENEVAARCARRGTRGHGNVTPGIEALVLSSSLAAKQLNLSAVAAILGASAASEARRDEDVATRRPSCLGLAGDHGDVAAVAGTASADEDLKAATAAFVRMARREPDHSRGARAGGPRRKEHRPAGALGASVRSVEGEGPAGGRGGVSGANRHVPSRGRCRGCAGRYIDAAAGTRVARADGNTEEAGFSSRGVARGHAYGAGAPGARPSS